MSSSNEDLKNSFRKIRNILYRENEHRRNEADMWSLINILLEELESNRESEACASRNFEQFLKSDTANITSLYVSLKEKCEELEKENAERKNQLDRFKIQTAIDAQKQKDEYLQNISKSEEKYNCEITKLEEKIASVKILLERKGNEVELLQAAADLKYDELESDLKRQLVDANNKLRNAHNVIGNLNREIYSLRNQIASLQTQISHKPPKLSKAEIRFQPLPVKIVHPSFNYEDSDSDDQEFVEPVFIRNVEPAVAHTEPLYRSSTSTPSNRSSTRDRTTPLVFRGTSEPVPKSTVPSADKGGKPRKRKLYDPDNFDQSNVPTF